MKRLGSFLFIALWGCSDGPEHPTWRIRPTSESGRPLANIPVLLYNDGAVYRLQSDSQGEILLDKNDAWDAKPLAVDGCPVHLAEVRTEGLQLQWRLVVPDSLYRACKDTFLLQVLGRPDSRARWSVAPRSSYPLGSDLYWQPEFQDSTLLDSTGQGQLKFTSLLNPFVERSMLRFGADRDTLATWWIDPEDSTVHLLPSQK